MTEKKLENNEIKKFNWNELKTKIVEHKIFKNPKLVVVLGLVLVLVFSSIGFATYAYFTDTWILVKGQRSIADNELKVSVEGKELKVEKNKFKLEKSLYGKKITISNPDYKTKEFSFNQNLNNTLNPVVWLEPVDYVKVVLKLSTDKESINSDLSGITINGEPVKNVNEEFDGQVESKKMLPGEALININYPNFTPVKKAIKTEFGRYFIDLKLEYNLHFTTKITNFVNSTPLADVEVKSVGLKSDSEGVITLDHLENQNKITFSKEGFNSKEFDVLSLQPEISLSPLGKIVYPKMTDPNKYQYDLYKANFDGTETEKVVDNVLNAYQFGNEAYFIQGNIDTSFDFQIKKIDLTTNQIQELETYKNDIDVPGNNAHKNIIVELSAKVLLINEEDNGRLFPSYNKFWIKKIQDPNLNLIRDRKFPINTSESLNCCTMSKDGLVVAYETRKMISSSKGRTSTSVQKVVNTASGEVLYDKEYPQDQYPYFSKILEGNKYGLFTYSPLQATSNTYGRALKLINFQTKSETDLPSDLEVMDLTIDNQNETMFAKKVNAKTSFLKYNAETNEYKTIFEAENVKNKVVLNNRLYVRLDQQWYLIDDNGKAKAVDLKPNFQLIHYFWGSFSGFAGDADYVGGIPQEVLDTTF